MESLTILEAALIEDDKTGVINYLTEVDRKSANEAMRLMGESIGFETMEINGNRYAHLGSASPILGYSDASGLAKLLDRYQIMTPKIGWFGHDVRTSVRETFNLNPTDSVATFIPYEGILIAGMQGQTEGAKKIKLYLLKMEKTARVGIMTSDQLKQADHKVRRLEKQINMAVKITRMPDGPLKESALEAYEQLTGKKLPEPAQLKLIK